MRILLLLCLLAAVPAWAADASDSAAGLPDAPPPPPPPPASAPGTQPNTNPGPPAPSVGADQQDSLEPEVTIIQRQHTTIEEYRVHGRLQYVKITPDKGFPYYLIDTNGDGILDTRSDNLDNPPINQWILFQW
ncbi:MAG: DUF2782 domain-containing protein [Gammaproteobacteria bacterium]|nr:DUF2782 domain-containing protein [Gammaproteobacteria bacterium]